MATEAPPAKRAKPTPLADEKAPRPRNVLLAEFEGLAKADASQALRDTGGDLDKARALLRSTGAGFARLAGLSSSESDDASSSGASGLPVPPVMRGGSSTSTSITSGEEGEAILTSQSTARATTPGFQYQNN